MLGKRGTAQAEAGQRNILRVLTGFMFIGGLILLTGMGVIYGFINKGDFYEKTILVNEIGLNIDLLQLFDDNAYFYYYTPDNYTVTVSLEKVTVSQQDRPEEYLFVRSNDLHLREGTFTDSSLVFAKQGSDILIGKAPLTFNRYARECQRKDPTPLTTLALADTEEHTTHNSTEQALVTEIIARMRSNNAQLYSATATQSTQPLLAIRATGTDNIVRAYIPANEHIADSKYLACELLNRVTAALQNESIAIEGAAIIPVNPAALEPHDMREVLTSNAVRVLIDVGTTTGVETTGARIAQALHEGVIRYGTQRVST
ncbi:hypothetical protein GF342_05020 [Candidatus Woesearchaeota archaeon]|nr:hypothetical protein [Candidatus Woesearchaeota archaeon]